MTSKIESDEIARRITIPLHLDVSARERSVAINNLIAGGIAGMAGVIVGHPFDSIKVRYQMAGTRSSAATTAAQSFGGISSLFRGIGAPVTMAALVNATIFTTYGESSRLWDRHVDNSSSNILPKQLVCGTATGFVSSIIMSPTELVKIKMQTQISGSETSYRNSLDAARSILSTYGIKGFYRGFVPTCLRQCPGFAVYFGCYGRIKDQLKGGVEHPWLPSIIAGGVAGSLSWAVVYPIDLVKSRIQALPLSTTTKSERSIWNVAKAVVQQQGWRSLYRGMGITVFRAFPVNGIIFPTYELTSSMLGKRVEV